MMYRTIYSLTWKSRVPPATLGIKKQTKHRTFQKRYDVQGAYPFPKIRNVNPFKMPRRILCSRQSYK